MLALLLMAAGQMSPAETALMEGGLRPWFYCIQHRAHEWALQRGDASVIARGAVASCSQFESAARSGIFDSFRLSRTMDYSRAVAEADRALERARSSQTELAIATVLEFRARATSGQRRR